MKLSLKILKVFYLIIYGINIIFWSSYLMDYFKGYFIPKSAIGLSLSMTIAFFVVLLIKDLKEI
jgi:hypothetical protein